LDFYGILVVKRNNSYGDEAGASAQPAREFLRVFVDLKINF
jgi:hypothetical protein